MEADGEFVDLSSDAQFPFDNEATVARPAWDIGMNYIVGTALTDSDENGYARVQLDTHSPIRPQEWNGQLSDDDVENSTVIEE